MIEGLLVRLKNILIRVEVERAARMACCLQEYPEVRVDQRAARTYWNCACQMNVDLSHGDAVSSGIDIEDQEWIEMKLKNVLLVSAQELEVVLPVGVVTVHGILDLV